MIKLTPKNYMLIERILTWGVSPLAIPAMRFFQDPPDLRKRLFIRDFSTFTLGALMFFIPMALAEKGLKMTRWGKQFPLKGRMAAFLTGLLCYELFAGIGAIKLSEWFDPKPLQGGERPNPVQAQSRPMPTNGPAGRERTVEHSGAAVADGHPHPGPGYGGYYPYMAMPMGYGYYPY